MKISRDWLTDYIDLDGLGNAELAVRLTEIGHAVEGIEAVWPLVDLLVCNPRFVGLITGRATIATPWSGRSRPA